MPISRNMYRFHFKLGNKIVYTGITNDPYRRVWELKQEPGWEKGHLKEFGWRVTFDDAVAWELEQARRGKPVKQSVVDSLAESLAKKKATEVGSRSLR